MKKFLKELWLTISKKNNINSDLCIGVQQHRLASQSIQGQGRYGVESTGKGKWGK